MDWESLVWNTPLPPTRKFLLAAIARCADVSGFAPMTTLQLAATTGLGSRTVREQMALAEAAGNVHRFPRIGFQISLTQPDSPSGASRRIAYLEAEPPAAMRRVPPHGISAPYMERTSDPFGASPPVISPVLSSPVLDKDKELTQESVSEGQAELIPFDLPDWYLRLRRHPIFESKPFSSTDIREVEKDCPDVDLASEASKFVAYWQGQKRHLTIPLTAWRNWLEREKRNGSERRSGHKNGRYRALGAIIPKGGTPEADAFYGPPR